MRSMSLRFVFLLLWLVACAGQRLPSGAQTVVRSDVSSVSPDGRSLWIIGEHGAILHSSDGGESFDAQSSGVNVALRSVSFASAVHGVVVGERGAILSTEDGGAIWRRVELEAMETSLNAVALARSWGLGVAAGEQGVILVSHDSGRHFSRVASPTNESIVHVSLDEDSERVVLTTASGRTFSLTIAEPL